MTTLLRNQHYKVQKKTLCIIHGINKLYPTLLRREHPILALLAVIRLDGTTRRVSHESPGKVLATRLFHGYVW